MEPAALKSTALFLTRPCRSLLRLTRINSYEFLISRQVSTFFSFRHATELALIGQCTHSMLAHLDGVTSLSIDASGFSLVSGSHDCSVRFWDLMGSRSCIQELTTHREKPREGVLDPEF